MSLTLPPPPREKTSPTAWEQWVEDLWRKVSSLLSGTEIVAARYTTTTAANYTAETRINYNVKDYDTHDAVTTGAGVWQFVAPIAGFYRVEFQAWISNVAGGNHCYLYLYANGAAKRLVALDGLDHSSTAFVGGGSDTVYISAGQTIYVTVQSSDASVDLNTSNNVNTIAITRLSGVS